MPREIDFNLLVSMADDAQSAQRLRSIEAQRREALHSNKVPSSGEFYALSISGRRINVRDCSAWSSMEVFSEIFLEDNHFLAEGFGGSGAGFVFDIGANEGYYSMRLKEASPDCRIIALEPNPYAYEALARNLKASGVEGVRTLPLAAGRDNGHTAISVIREISGIGGHDICMADRPWLAALGVERIEARTATLDSLWDEAGRPPVDILKIDVEGMELDVLSGGRNMLSRVARIVVEWHGDALKNAVCERLSPAGWRLVCEELQGRGRYYGDMYFVNEAIQPAASRGIGL